LIEGEAFISSLPQRKESPQPCRPDDMANTEMDTTPGLGEQIEALGQEYNSLEERITELERTNPHNKYNSLEERITELERTNPHNKPLLNSSPPLSEKLTLALNTTHSIAQELIRRLGNGDQLNSTLQAQLRASLGAESRPITPSHSYLPPTPALDDSAGLRTAADSTDERPLKRPQGRPPKKSIHDRKLSVSVSSTDMNQAAETPATLKQPVSQKDKEPLGRPRKAVAMPPQTGTPGATGDDTSSARNSLASASAASSKTSNGGVVETKESSEQPDGEGDASQEYVDNSMDVDEAECRDKSGSIPPERRSARKPKPTEKAGFLTWKSIKEARQ